MLDRHRVSYAAMDDIETLSELREKRVGSENAAKGGDPGHAPSEAKARIIEQHLKKAQHQLRTDNNILQS